MKHFPGHPNPELDLKEGVFPARFLTHWKGFPAKFSSLQQPIATREKRVWRAVVWSRAGHESS